MPSTDAPGAAARPTAPRHLARRAAALLWRFARAHPVPLAVSLTGAAVYALGVVAGAAVVGRLTDTVVIPALEDGDIGAGVVLVGGGLVVAVAILRTVGAVGRRYFGSTWIRRLQAGFRRQLARHYIRMDVRQLRRRPSGELLATFDNDVDRAVEGMFPLPLSLSVAVLGVAAVVSLLAVDPYVGLVALVLVPVLALANRSFSRRLEGPAAEGQARLGDLSALAHESFDGALVIKTLGREEAEVERFDRAADRLLSQRLQVARLRASYEPLLDQLPNIASLVVVVVGAWRISGGSLTTGQLVQAITLFGLLAFPLRMLGYFLEMLPIALVSVARIDAVLAEGEPLPPPAGAPRSLPPGPLRLDLDAVAVVGGSVADDEARRGEGGDRGGGTLDQVSASVQPGERVALVGATGSGKSTLCELAVRLADPDAGQVRLGGVPIREVDPDELHRRACLVLQESFLFADTVAANVSLGDPDIDHDAVWAALRLARAEAFVAALPRGLDTVLGERGVTLSGGQRQRVALARALVRRPGLLVLDDATSAVDPVIEAEILAGLAGGADDGPAGATATTLLVVAHRLSTIRLADRVLFLHEGRIVAEGTHAELLARPAYAALVRAYEDEGRTAERAGVASPSLGGEGDGAGWSHDEPLGVPGS